MANRDILKTETVWVRVMELAPGASTGWHFHHQVSDYFVCMEGAIVVETRQPAQEMRLLPGQPAQVAPLIVHRVINPGAGPAAYLLVQGVGEYDFCPEDQPSAPT